MEFDVNTFRAIWPVVTLVVNLVFILIAFALRKTFATKRELSAVKADHYDLKHCHEQLSKRVDAMPTSKEIEKITVNMEALRGDMKAVVATLTKNDHMLTLLLENELKEKN
ncbi:MAG: DUF2730 family protein [Vibrio sp.]